MHAVFLLLAWIISAYSDKHGLAAQCSFLIEVPTLLIALLLTEWLQQCTSSLVSAFCLASVVGVGVVAVGVSTLVSAYNTCVPPRVISAYVSGRPGVRGKVYGTLHTIKGGRSK